MMRALDPWALREPRDLGEETGVLEEPLKLKGPG
jgi:hypothetical protein